MSRPRKHPGVRGPRPDLRVARREEAQHSIAAWRRLSTVEQLRVLDARLGKGQGAKKQRARLVAAITADMRAGRRVGGSP